MSVRLARLRALLDDLRLEGVVVGAPADVRYLSGFRGDDTMLVVGREVALLCTDARFWEQARDEAADFELIEAVAANLMADTVGAAARRLGPEARLGFQGVALTYQQYRGLRRRHRGRLRDVGAHVSRLRIVKQETEVGAMRRAGALTDEALAAVVTRGLIGRREADVAWDLAAEYHRLGAEGEAFPAIVAAGAHGAQAHAIPGEHVIARGELVVIDTGARVDGYCSDITRTFAAGELSGELRRVYDVVLAAQLAGLAAVRAGAHGRLDVDAAARSVIADAGFSEKFGHGTGHGVGLEVHEAPALGRTRGDPLAAGMVCTVEPGIYLEGLAGVRIEDTVLVTAAGHERLTTLPKELQIVG
jgi:Xaa-Pro aminopeptidase